MIRNRIIAYRAVLTRSDPRPSPHGFQILPLFLKIRNLFGAICADSAPTAALTAASINQQPDSLNKHIERICAEIREKKKRNSEMRNDKSQEQKTKTDNKFPDIMIHTNNPFLFHCSCFTKHIFAAFNIIQQVSPPAP